MINALIDSSFLFALNSLNDKQRLPALSIAYRKDINYIIPDVVVGEVAYMLRSRIHQLAVIKFLATTAESQFTLIPILKEDIARAGQVMHKYRESDLDFVDCCLVALAERLNITHICTFDERDFRKIVPDHAHYFTILPADLS